MIYFYYAPKHLVMKLMSVVVRNPINNYQDPSMPMLHVHISIKDKFLTTHIDHVCCR